MNFVTIDEVYAIHQRMIAIGGGRPDILNLHLLHSAIERPKATFGGHDLYPNIYDKAAALIHSLIKNHSFDDGNKRTAYYTTKRFFYINGYVLNAKKAEIITFTVSVDVDNPTLEIISSWLKTHCDKIT